MTSSISRLLALAVGLLVWGALLGAPSLSRAGPGQKPAQANAEQGVIVAANQVMGLLGQPAANNQSRQLPPVLNDLTRVLTQSKNGQGGFAGGMLGQGGNSGQAVLQSTNRVLGLVLPARQGRLLPEMEQALKHLASILAPQANGSTQGGAGGFGGGLRAKAGNTNPSGAGASPSSSRGRGRSGNNQQAGMGGLIGALQALDRDINRLVGVLEGGPSGTTSFKAPSHQHKHHLDPKNAGLGGFTAALGALNRDVNQLTASLTQGGPGSLVGQGAGNSARRVGTGTGAVPGDRIGQGARTAHTRANRQNMAIALGNGTAANPLDQAPGALVGNGPSKRANGDKGRLARKNATGLQGPPGTRLGQGGKTQMTGALVTGPGGAGNPTNVGLNRLKNLLKAQQPKAVVQLPAKAQQTKNVLQPKGTRVATRSPVQKKAQARAPARLPPRPAWLTPLA